MHAEAALGLDARYLVPAKAPGDEQGRRASCIKTPATCDTPIPGPTPINPLKYRCASPGRAT